MKKKEYFKKTLFTILTVICFVLFVPGTDLSPYAAMNDKSDTYRSVVYDEGKDSLNTVSEVTRKISSYGVLADNSDYTEARVYLDSDDFRRVAYLINSFNKQLSSTDTANNRSYNNAIINKKLSKNLFSKIGYESSVSVPTTKVDGFDKAEETRALTEKILDNIR